jgi:hypothetical protein
MNECRNFLAALLLNKSNKKFLLASTIHLRKNSKNPSWIPFHEALSYGLPKAASDSKILKAVCDPEKSFRKLPMTLYILADFSCIQMSDQSRMMKL